MLTDVQHRDFDVLEGKIEKISREVIKLREENGILKQSLHTAKKDNGELLDTIDN